jgi:hypothetical protein
MPHILHLVVQSNPKVQQFSIEWDGDLRGDEEWDLLDERLEIPKELFNSVGKLGNLEVLSIKNIPFLAYNFMLNLLNQLPSTTSLHTLRLVPRHMSRSDDLDLPTVEYLEMLCEDFPSLRHLTISVNIANPPPNVTGETTDPDYGLKSLFIVPPFGELDTDIPLSQLIPLATYLDSLFPHLDDVTSYFADRLSKGIIGPTSSRTLECWKNLDGLLKSYQQIRTRSLKNLRSSP